MNEHILVLIQQMTIVVLAPDPEVQVLTQSGEDMLTQSGEDMITQSTE